MRVKCMRFFGVFFAPRYVVMRRAGAKMCSNSCVRRLLAEISREILAINRFGLRAQLRARELERKEGEGGREMMSVYALCVLRLHLSTVPRTDPHCYLLGDVVDDL